MSAAAGQAPTTAGTRARTVAGVIALGLALQAAVFGLLFPHLWYNLHYITDIDIYQWYASMMHHGLQPYRDFHVEYPPLAVPLFVLPGHTGSLAQYTSWFSYLMFLFALAMTAVTGAAAAVLWPTGRRAYAVVALLALATAATGAILENRYDIVVALVIAFFTLFLIQRQLLAAAFALGIGFALKLTPLALLPLVLLFVARPRRALGPLAMFTVAAALPFVPYLISSPRGIWYVFDYHLQRPLQVESVLATPLMVGRALHISSGHWVYSHGSHAIAAPGAHLLATLSGPLTLAALAATYAVIVRRRALLRAAPHVAPLAVLAVILTIMAFGKVLSPQYVIWMLPVVALVGVQDRVLAVLALATLVLTQVEFPARYGDLLAFDPATVLVVAARNLLLLATLGITLWRLMHLPEEPAPLGVTSRPPLVGPQATAIIPTDDGGS